MAHLHPPLTGITANHILRVGSFLAAPCNRVPL